MGNRIPSVDMILSSVFHPMMNAYIMGQYQQAANLLYALNSFLVGFGEGIENLPKPIAITDDIISRAQPSEDYKRYYNKYSNLVVKKMGKYIRSVLDSLPKQFYIADYGATEQEV